MMMITDHSTSLVLTSLASLIISFRIGFELSGFTSAWMDASFSLVLLHRSPPSSVFSLYKMICRTSGTMHGRCFPLENG